MLDLNIANIPGIFSHEASDDLTVTATFPESNPFGRKSNIDKMYLHADTTVLVNGEKNNLQIHLQNHGKKNYTLVSAASSFHDTDKHWATVSLPHTYSAMSLMLCRFETLPPCDTTSPWLPEPTFPPHTLFTLSSDPKNSVLPSGSTSSNKEQPTPSLKSPLSIRPSRLSNPLLHGSTHRFSCSGSSSVQPS